MDVGKQCAGALIIHWINIVFSILLVAHAATNDDEVQERTSGLTCSSSRV